MNYIKLLLLILILSACAKQTISQSVNVTKDFSLGSPYHEPDGRNDLVKVSATDIVTLAKVKGNLTGKSDFVLERYDQALNKVWQTPLTVESFEDYKDVYFNGKEVVLLSVIHNEKEKTTKLEAYGFDIKTGAKIWTKELEQYQVGDWETHPHKGMVKESFIDVICEHTNREFVTPIEYKHNIRFSPDGQKFVSYVYNYGEKNLTVSVAVYDNSGNLLNKGKISIDNDFISHGIYVNNRGQLFIVNANKFGKLNLIRYDLSDKSFDLLDLPGSNLMKDDFHLMFLTDDLIYVANTELVDGKIAGVMYTKFDFASKQMLENTYKDFTAEDKQKIITERKNDKQIKGEEDWRDYDLTDFFVDKNEEVLIVFEKRVLYADAYPHIGRDVFDAKHEVEINGHVQAEGIIIVSFTKEDAVKWMTYIPKNQVYAAADGLNTISFVLDNTHRSNIRILYATSENMDASFHNINLVEVDRQTGKKTIRQLENNDKLTLARDYTSWLDEGNLVIVGKKGLLGKTSVIKRYKL